MRTIRPWWRVPPVATLLLWSFVVAHVFGGGASTHLKFPETVPLPQTADIGTQFVYKQFHVRPATPKDLAGKSTHGIPASVVTVFDGVGSWDGPSSASPPVFVLNSSASIRSKVALFQIETGLGGGWIAVPKSWRVISADAGAQGSWGATLVAPGGPRDGWLLIGGSGPGTTEVFSAAEGYFPGAFQLENELFPGTLTHDSTLWPKPDSLARPDPCTALVSYRSGGLVVKSIRHFGRDGMTSFWVALTPTNAALQTFLLRAYRTEHPVLKCVKNVRDW